MAVLQERSPENGVNRASPGSPSVDRPWARLPAVGELCLVVSQLETSRSICVVIPGLTRNPVVHPWIPADAGMTVILSVSS